MDRKERGKIVTVTGEMEADETLFFQCHEHLLLAWGRAGEMDPALYFDEPEKSFREAEDYLRAGGRGLVEAQPVGCGRMAGELQKIAEHSGLRLVASTGFHKMAFYPEEHWIFSATEQWLTDLFLRELREGMYVDGDKGLPQQWIPARAGQIKTALEHTHMDGQYKKLFLAAANAARETGAPVMIHVENGHHPMEYFDLLTREGILPEQMIFCHLDRAWQDLGLHKELAGAGAFLEYDTIARDKYHSDEEELEIFRAMIDGGLEDQLLFSLDTTRKRLKAYGGTIGLTYILDTFLSKMLRAGISPAVIDRISKKNPARAMSWMSL